MLYEALLLFGVVFIAAWLFSTLMQQRHALYLRHALQYWLFFVVGLYFVWFWIHGGQTLPMKTWHIRLLRADGGPVRVVRAICRYVLSWMWFLPGLVLAWAIDAHAWALVLLPMLNMVLWASTVYLDPERQFLHDRLAGTRLVMEQPQAPAAKPASPA
jgi:uncharacterized RDD family membrane protein YckC